MAKVNISKLRRGDRIQTVDGNLAEVMDESQDGEWVKVRYVESSKPELIDTEDLCSVDDVESVSSVEA